MFKSTFKLSLFFLISLLINTSCEVEKQASISPDAPNILFVIADDWSFPHAGIYGDKTVQTPNFDQVAENGILFNNAYVASPSCTPSRAAVLSGQHIWRLKEGANLYGPLRPEIPTYTDIMQEAGYHVGHTLKGWGPGKPEGRPHNPAGKKYESFEQFLTDNATDNPFCFWFGSYNPHRGYKRGSGAEAGIDLQEIELPAPFPDSESIRSDVADYYLEVQAFDDELGALLKKLEEIGELENTIIAVTSDNGMPFPRCKSNLYDLGTRVPLAIQWGDKINMDAPFEDFVSLTDLAPTFLEAAGLEIPKEMTGESLLSELLSKKQEKTPNRKQVFFGKERHVPGQESGNWEGYPSRAIRTKDYLYIRNFKPDSWPAGTPNYQKASFFPSYYGDVDGGPTRTYMIEEKEASKLNYHLFELSFGKRPAEELYNLNHDPHQLNNVADSEDYTEIKENLWQQLSEELKITGDPRMIGGEEIFSNFPYTGGAPSPDNFRRKNQTFSTIRIDDFPSEYVNPRPVEILVPVNVKHDQTFPVLYMFDGQNLFHSFEGWGGEENLGWRVHEVLDSLIKAEVIPPVIVVGIFNGRESRGAEYMPAKPKDMIQKRIEETDNEWYRSFKDNPPASDEQLKFVVEELKPYIDANFKTKADPENTFVSGSSMGGLISAYAICEYPEVFGGAACFSTHWVMFDGVFLEYIKESLPDPATHKIYFDFGTEGLDGEYEPYQKLADGMMLARGFKKGENWITLKFEGAKHHEDDWHERFHIPIEFLMGRKE